MPIGAALAAARDARGQSVEDVAASTRIRAAVIRAIEGDDFSRCGGAAYARGHIRSIARVVGVDPQPLVDEFDEQHQGAVPHLQAGPLPTLDRSPDLRRVGRPRARWATVAIGVLAVVVVFLVASLLLNRNSPGTSSATGTAAQSASAAAGQTTPPASSATTQPSSPTPTTPAPSGVSLRVTAAGGDSWLLVTSSAGAQVYEGILAQGQSMGFHDGRLLTVKFGNSRVVTLTLNGRSVGAPTCGDIVCSQQFPTTAAAG